MKDYLFCVDSDGCAMDTMTYKHKLLFGPLAVEIFGIKNSKEFLEYWNHVNLYSKTRGVNRFVGLSMGLQFAKVKGIDEYVKWVQTTSELSNHSLKKEIDKNPDDSLVKALLWSNKVNQEIEEGEELDHPFKGVKDGLLELKKYGQVMIVSSANKEAVMKEWQKHELLEAVDEVACQDRGKKEDIIKQLLKDGWLPNQLLMIGDSPGDLEAAKINAISFYPILVNHEEKSWVELKEKVVKEFVSGQYAQKEEEMIQTFWLNLENN